MVFHYSLSHTPPLFHARARKFCPSVNEASIRIFPFTAISSSPGTTPPTSRAIRDYQLPNIFIQKQWHANAVSASSSCRRDKSSLHEEALKHFEVYGNPSKHGNRDSVFPHSDAVR